MFSWQNSQTDLLPESDNGLCCPIRNSLLIFVALWMKIKLLVWPTGPLRSSSGQSLRRTSGHPCCLHCNHTGLSSLPCRLLFPQLFPRERTLCTYCSFCLEYSPSPSCQVNSYPPFRTQFMCPSSREAFWLPDKVVSYRLFPDCAWCCWVASVVSDSVRPHITANLALEYGMKQGKG